MSRKKFEHLVVGVVFGDDYVRFFDHNGTVGLDDIERRGYELVAVQTVNDNSLAFFKREYRKPEQAVFVGFSDTVGIAHDTGDNDPPVKVEL